VYRSDFVLARYVPGPETVSVRETLARPYLGRTLSNPIYAPPGTPRRRRMMCSLNLQPSIPNHPKANVRQQPDRPIARPQRVVRMGCENPRERLPGGHRYAQGVRMVAYGSVRKQANPGDPTPPRVSG